MDLPQQDALNTQVFERARLSRDARFDGRFFVAVSTTGIYCRPICPANPPRSENVRFFPTAAAAAEAGYRPCLRCRPETAPGTPAWGGTSTTVRRGLRLIANGALDGGNVEQLAERLGVTSRHLRRLFNKHLGASPLAVAHTQRLHFAKRLIDDSDLPLSAVAEAAGYGSVRRFNDAFRNSYGRPPSMLRRVREGRRSAEPSDSAPLTVTVPYRKPFDWPAMLRYFAARATPGVEVVAGDVYRRSIHIDGSAGVLEVKPAAQREALRLTLHGVATAHLFPVVQIAREMLDVDAPVEEIAATLEHDDLLCRRLKSAPGIRVPGAWDGFELAVRTILGQQVSVAGATTQAGKLARAYGAPLEGTPGKDANWPRLVFPTPQRLATARIERCGIISSRATAIRSLARSVLAGEIRFDIAQDPETFRQDIQSIKGIGAWTAEYLAMRVLKDPDAFPATDLGLRQALESSGDVTPAAVRDRAEPWRPWRAYAAMLLWQPAEMRA
ncbi:MAG: AlkA N-terminal domain-containing protein, partial [Xanthomonadales bacterium]|nr:AlkA N-terminal domain-containing protein [Xanthomonadales bacterium]